MSSQQSLITVVIATYKRAEHLDRAIRSVLSQPGDFWELLIGDDGSPDHTPEIIARYKDDPRVRHYRNTVNLGMQDNLLRIVRESRGRYVFILTDDDYMLPDALEKTKVLIEKYPDAGYFLSHLPTVDERSGKIVHWHKTFEQDTFVEPSIQSMAEIAGSAWVLSRQVLRYDLIDWATWEKFKMNIFFPLIAAGRMLLKAPMAYLAEPLVMHTQFNEVFWEKFGRNELEIQFNLDRDAYRCMRAILHDYEPTSEVQRTIDRWEFDNLKTYLYRMDKGFYDLIRADGVRAATTKLLQTHPLNRQQKQELVLFIFKIPNVRLWRATKMGLRRLPAPLVDMLQRLRMSSHIVLFL